MISLNLFWTHLIKAKSERLSENSNFKDIFYSLLDGFSLEPNNNDLFKITAINTKQFQNSLDLYCNILILEYNDLPQGLISYIRLYIPLLMASRLQPGRPFVISHYAQSLDGKISTPSGKSKWISNQDNLDHCHRLRALADGVLVGGETIKADKPKLTVRRVEGKNPKRIFWCNTIDDYSDYVEDGTYTILVTKNKIINTLPKGINHCIVYNNLDNPVQEVLNKLKGIGIHAIFIEGGSNTLSHFYNAKSIDLMQIHIAPLIFGSGKSALEMQAIDKVSDSLQLNGFFSFSDEHILYHGTPIYKD